MDTKPKAEVAPDLEQDSAESGITYYPPEDTDVVEAPEGPEGIATGPEGAEAVVPPGAEPGQGAAPAAPAAKAAPAPGMPEQPLLAQYQAALEAQRLAQSQQAEQLNQLRLAQELGQLRAAWEAEGHDEKQIAAGLAQHQQLRQREAALQAREQEVEQLLVRSRADDAAKIQVATMFSQKYGVPFADLMKYDTPQLMEAEARARKAEAALTKVQQGKVRATKMASVGPGSQGANSLAALRKRYAAGESLTPEQVEQVVHYRG